MFSASFRAGTGNGEPTTDEDLTTRPMRRLLNNLTFRVLVAITLGVILGVVSPATAKAMRPLGDTFVNLVKMVIAPIVFFTIVLGIATLGDLKRV